MKSWLHSKVFDIQENLIQPLLADRFVFIEFSFEKQMEKHIWGRDSVLGINNEDLGKQSTKAIWSYFYSFPRSGLFLEVVRIWHIF